MSSKPRTVLIVSRFRDAVRDGDEKVMKECIDEHKLSVTDFYNSYCSDPDCDESHKASVLQRLQDGNFPASSLKFLVERKCLTTDQLLTLLTYLFRLTGTKAYKDDDEEVHKAITYLIEYLAKVDSNSLINFRDIYSESLYDVSHYGHAPKKEYSEILSKLGVKSAKKRTVRA